MLVHQEAHQLRHRDGGVGVIELEAVLFRELAEVIAMQPDPLAQHVLETGAGEQVLLAQA